MCLVALAIDQSRRFPLVIAANRDEFFKRPTARLAWWSPGADRPDILGGRDLEAGGTWLGLTAAGRLAFITNVRDPSRQDPQAPSRGDIVPRWLSAELQTDRFWMRTALAGYNGFNLVAADFQRGECFWASSHEVHPVRLERGLFGLSNGRLDAPWPKVDLLKARVDAALSASDTVDTLSSRLFEALGDRTLAEDALLPSTGVSSEWEKLLSAAFIRTPDGSYGTRCSTLVITERVNKRLVTHVLERTYGASGGMALLRRSTLKDWPPRYSEEPPAEATAQGSVDEADDPPNTGAAVPRKKRVRSLLKPERPRRKRATGD